jgi:transmembrane sensor
MNESNQDKSWEIAAAIVHHEITSADGKEPDENLPESKAIQDDVSDLHAKLAETAPLHGSSIVHSWDRVAHYINYRKYRFYVSLLKYAAILLLAFVIGTLFNYNRNSATSPVFAEIHVPLGQMSEITLYDGTHVWLNSGTTFRYASNFGDRSRQVELEGEAFFKVKSGDVPFKVKIKNNEIEVLGTSFAAAAYPDEDFSQVTLVEGSVQINDGKGRTLRDLNAREQVNIPDSPDKEITTSKVNTLFYESWINGQIKFEEERLADVARRMERWYNVEIRFAGIEVSELRFTGTVLKNKPIHQSMQAISLLLPIKVKHESNLHKKDVITISKK